MYNNSYNRLMDLVQRTGDRLVVHNPIEDQNTVIMSLDEYEKLLDNQDYNDFRSYDVRNLSSDQLVDQINRDIAVWRANSEENKRWERERELEDEMYEEDMSSHLVEEDYQPHEWHSIGGVMDDQYVNKSPQDFDLDRDWDDDDNNKFSFTGAMADKDFLTDTNLEQDSLNNLGQDLSPDFDFKDNNFFDIDTNNDLIDDEMKVENIPLVSQNDLESDWKEEPLADDDPVFYEEPV